jgi:ribonuclease P protein component
MTATSARLTKIERLKNRGHIQHLFSDSSEKVANYPLLMLFNTVQTLDVSSPKILLSVSKKKFPTAVGRNRIKRQLREAYRKMEFSAIRSAELDKQILLALIYTGKEESTQDELNKALDEIFKILSQRIGKPS